MVQGENNEECFFFFFFCTVADHYVCPLSFVRSLIHPPYSLSYSSLIRVNFLITANDRATSGIRLNYYYPRSRSKLIERSFSKDSRKFPRKFCKVYIIFAFFLSSLLKFFSARFFLLFFFIARIFSPLFPYFFKFIR